MQPQYLKIPQEPNTSFRFALHQQKRLPFFYHFHPEYELVLITKGHGTRFIGDHIEKYKTGDLILLGPYLPHSWVLNENTGHEALVMHFNDDFLGPNALEKPELKNIKAVLKRSQAGLKFTGSAKNKIAKAIKTLKNEKGLNKLLGFLKILEQMALTKDVQSLNAASKNRKTSNQYQKRVEEISNYINENYTKPITQARVAKHVHLSTSSFSRFFKQTMGVSFPRYLNELRVGLACKLLMDDSQSITSICFACGFNNISNFNRQFLAIKTISPRSFKRKLKEIQYKNV